MLWKKTGEAHNSKCVKSNLQSVMIWGRHGCFIAHIGVYQGILEHFVLPSDRELPFSFLKRT